MIQVKLLTPEMERGASLGFELGTIYKFYYFIGF